MERKHYLEEMDELIARLVETDKKIHTARLKGEREKYEKESKQIMRDIDECLRNLRRCNNA